MNQKQKQFLRATAILIGLIIGVGIFGVPYVITKAGFFPAIFYFLVLGAAMILTTLFYGEVNLRTQGKHRIVGYAEKYLGKRGKIVAALAQIFGFYGAIIAYIIVGGEFLFSLLGGFLGGEVIFYQFFIFAFISIFVVAGLRLLSWLEVILTSLLLLVILVVLAVGFPKIEISNYETFEWAYLFLPYGVILFSLGGTAAVPELKEVLSKNLKLMKKVIIVGVVISILLTAAFGFIIAGITGGATTDEALSGLQGILSPPIITAGIIFGLLSIATSLLVIGINLKETFLYDYKIKSNLIAWFLALGVPFLIFLFGLHGFIKVISIAGGVFGGLGGILIVLMFLKAKKAGVRKPEYKIDLPKFIPYVLIGVFGLGILYEIFYLFMNGF